MGGGLFLCLFFFFCFFFVVDEGPLTSRLENIDEHLLYTVLVRDPPLSL